MIHRILLALALAIAATAHAGEGPKDSYRQGIKAMERGDWDWAVVYFQRAADLKPGNIDYKARLEQAKQKASFQHFEAAKKHLAAGSLDEAIAELQQTVSLNPTHQYAYVELEKALAEWRRQQALRDDEAGEMARRKQEADAIESVPKLDPSSNVPIQFQLDNKPLKDIFEVISDVSNINVIFDDGVQLDKSTSLVTENTTLEEALDLLMLKENLAFKVINDNTVLIYQNNQTKQREYEDRVIRTFYLSNADVKEVNAILRSVVDLRKTAVNEQLNAITIIDSADKIAIAGRLIEANDKAKAELIIDLEILEVNQSKLKKYGIDIRSKDSPGIATSVGFDDTEVRLNNLRRLNQLGSYIATPIPSAIIQLLRQDSDTKTLSRPQVRVTDNEQVTMHLGDQVPIPNTTFNTSTTSGTNIVPVTSFTYQNVGIEVTLEPRIHHNREITLKLQAEVSSVASVSQSGQPTIGTRKVDTVIRLRDGETNLLAGLLQQQDARSLAGVPGLTDIPILKRIFGATQKTNRETEIILTVTPHIVRVPDISVADLAALQVGTERDPRLKGAGHYGVGGSPFRSADEKPPEDPFTSLRPGALDNDPQRAVVPDPGLASGAVRATRRDPLVVTNETLDRMVSGGSMTVLSPRGDDGAQPSAAPAPGPAAPTRPSSGAAGAGPSSAPGGGTSGGASVAPPPTTTSARPAPAPPAPAPAPAPEEDVFFEDEELPPEPAPVAPTPSPGPGRASAPAPTGPARLSMAASQPQLRVGERMTLEVRVDASGNEIAHIPYHVRFDPRLVLAGQPTEGGFFRQAGANSLFLPDVQAGRIIVGHSQFGGSQSVSGTGVLAVIPIEALAPGEAVFALENVAVSDRAADAVPFRIEELRVRITP